MGTNHHWNLRGGGAQGGACLVFFWDGGGQGGPPDGHEVEDVGHPGAVAEEAADGHLEDDGDHQDVVPAGTQGVGVKRGPL